MNDTIDPSYPKYFYKYRKIENHDNLENDFAIDALINNKAYFSSRTKFNDIFDSKLELIKPTPREIKELSRHVTKNHREILKKYINKGNFTPLGDDYINDCEKEFNTLLDKYLFFCVSKNPACNLMWSHYADSHKGFCIEFKSEYLKAKKIAYKERIPRLKIIDLLKIKFNVDLAIGEKLHVALETKLIEWSYESEYRFMADNSMAEKIRADKNNGFYYETHYVESVIFGIRTPANVKDFITRKLPAQIKIKQAVAITSGSIEISQIR